MATASDPFADVETARLAVIDFAGFDTDPARRKAISRQIHDACNDIGFFVLTNHGIPDVDRQFEIAKELFSLPFEEKEKFNMGTKGNYFGYKRIGQQIVNSKGDGDGNEYYNTAKASSKENQRDHPLPIKANKATMDKFSKDCHDLVLKLLGIFSEQFGKEPDFFGKRHRWEKPSGDMIRMIRYPPRPEEERVRVDGVGMAGHSDFGSITLLFNQSVGGLQVLDKHDGRWKYVKPVPGAIIINIGDSLQFWTNGRLRSSMHRVVTPPGSQKNETRYSVVYFSRPEDSCELTPIDGKQGADDKIWTAGEWIAHRVRSSQSANYVNGGNFIGAPENPNNTAEKRTSML